MKRLLDRFHLVSARLGRALSGIGPKLILTAVGALAAILSGLPLVWAAIASGVLLDLFLSLLAGCHGLVGQLARAALALDLSVDLIAIIAVPSVVLGCTIGATFGYALAFLLALVAAVGYCRWLAAREGCAITA